MTYLTSSSSNSPAAKEGGVLYQIDCCKASSGKTVSLTKRRVRWRFGFANRKAMEQGATGVDCRGYEHEVTFVWSVASGKKLIVHDQKEVHYSQGKREGKFTFMWTAGGCMFTLIAYAAPPVSKNHRAYGKQFELLIDNVPFDALPRIYQLGAGLKDASSMNGHHFVSQGISNSSFPTNGATQYNRRSIQDEMAWARSMHAMEARRNMNDHVRSNSPASVVTKSNHDAAVPVEFVEAQDLMSASILPSPVGPGSAQDLLSEPLPMSSGTFAFSVDHMHSQPEDEFSPHQPPSYEAIWSSIMDAYDSGAPHRSTLAQNQWNSHSSHGYNHAMPIISTSVEHVKYSEQGLFVETHMEPKSSTSVGLVSPTDVTALDGAFQNLVNLDDISQPVLQSYAPSKKNHWEGKENLPLKDLKKPADAPKKEIMRTYGVYPQQNSGALVVYGQGQSQYNQQGPAPLSFGYSY